MMDFFFQICAVNKKQKPMKKVLSLFIIVFVTTSLSAQEKEKESKTSKGPWTVQTGLEGKAYDDSFSKMKLHFVEFTVNTIKEMDQIDWDDIFGVFKENAPTDSIEVAVVLKDYKVRNENDVLMSIPRLRVAVSGETKDTTELRARMKMNIEKTTRAIRKFKN